MFVHNRVPNFPPRRMRARANPRERCLAVAGIDDPGRVCSHDFSFHVRNDFFRLMIPPVNH